MRWWGAAARAKVQLEMRRPQRSSSRLQPHPQHYCNVNSTRSGQTVNRCTSTACPLQFSSFISSKPELYFHSTPEKNQVERPALCVSAFASPQVCHKHPLSISHQQASKRPARGLSKIRPNWNWDVQCYTVIPNTDAIGVAEHIIERSGLEVVVGFSTA